MVVIIQHIEGLELSPIRQLILHEVHRLRMIGYLRHRQLVWLGSLQAFARPDTQVQFQLTVDPVHALVVPLQALHVAQIQKAQPKAPCLAISRHSNQPIRDLGVLIVELTLIAIAGLADLKRAASQCDADTLGLDCLHGHLSSLRCLTAFFQGPLSVSHSACSSQHTSASDGGFHPPSPSSAIPSTRPCRQTSHAICKSSHCSSHVHGKAQKPAHRFPPASKYP